MCNYVKIETGQNFPPVLKILTRTVQMCKMLMLLSVQVASVLFLDNNFALTTRASIEVTRCYSSRPFYMLLAKQRSSKSMCKNKKKTNF